MQIKRADSWQENLEIEGTFVALAAPAPSSRKCERWGFGYAPVNGVMALKPTASSASRQSRNFADRRWRLHHHARRPYIDFISASAWLQVWPNANELRFCRPSQTSAAAASRRPHTQQNNSGGAATDWAPPTASAFDSSYEIRRSLQQAVTLAERINHNGYRNDDPLGALLAAAQGKPSALLVDDDEVEGKASDAEHEAASALI